jgi:CRISPR-associated protein Cas1
MDRNYHVFQDGRLAREEGSLTVRTDDDIHRLPVENVGALYFHGQIDVNTRALDFLSQHGITAHLFNWNEHYAGSYVPRRALTSGNSLVQQAAYHLDERKRTMIARSIVAASAAEMRRNLTYYDNRGTSLREIIDRIDELTVGVGDTESVEALLGIEGNVRRAYYRSFSRILPEGFVLDRRVYNPPDNEVNSLISFGNSLLYSSILSELHNTHLDPTVSYLHEPGERRFSLCLDISELFKPLLVDRLLFRLVNRSQITKEDFDSGLNGCLLTGDGRRLFVREYEETLERTVKHPTLDRHVSYQYLLRLEGYKLHKHILGDKSYEPFSRWW